jgi:nicotinamidase-related amidase
MRFSNDFALLESEVARAFPAEVDAFRRLAREIQEAPDYAPLDASVLARPELRARFRDPLLIEALLLPIVDNICRVIEHARRERRPVVYLKAVYDRTFAVQPPSLRQAPERNHYPCKANSWGAALIEPIGQLVSDGIMDSVEKVIEKHTFDGFHQTELFGFLKSCKVQTVVMVGVETHVCVLATAQSAAVNYFKTIILEDCVWPAQDALGRAALAIFRDAFGSTALLRDHLDSAAFPTPPPVIPNA